MLVFSMLRSFGAGKLLAAYRIITTLLVSYLMPFYGFARLKWA